MKLNEIFKQRKNRVPLIGIATFAVTVPLAILIVSFSCNNYWCIIFPWQQQVIKSFEECVSLDYPVVESNPRRCLAPQGSFIENVEYQPAVSPTQYFSDENIILKKPYINTYVTSPLEIKGEARGSWFFEASFSIKIVDANDNILGQGHAEALEDWMTEEFVSFKAQLTFSTPETSIGFLVLQRDNPSGLTENEQEVRIPVQFAN